MILRKVNIGADRYFHKFQLSDGTISYRTTTKEEYGGLNYSVKPTKTDAVWLSSSSRIGFDTPSGELDDGQYATQKNGFDWVKLAGYEMKKLMPEDIYEGNML